MYSDGSMFCCIRATRSRVRRPIDSLHFDSRLTVNMVKHLDSVMIWAAFLDLGACWPVFPPKNTTMRGENYETVLKGNLILFMAIHRSTHILQDSAPFHSNKCIKDFLADKKFEVINSPGNSPDLNPIEHCWNYVHEGEAQVQGHWVSPLAHQGDQDPVDH
jgi:hypothetical protein